MEWTNLEAVLERYGTAARDAYRAELAARGKNTTRATLSGTAAPLTVRTDTGYEVCIALEDYWKYVEYGRRPGKFPPVKKIREWVEIKPLVPRPDARGRIPTVPQLAFLVARKIAREGIAPTPAMATAEALTWEEYEAGIAQAVEADIEAALNTDFGS